MGRSSNVKYTTPCDWTGVNTPLLTNGEGEGTPTVIKSKRAATPPPVTGNRLGTTSLTEQGAPTHVCQQNRKRLHKPLLMGKEFPTPPLK